MLSYLASRLRRGVQLDMQLLVIENLVSRAFQASISPAILKSNAESPWNEVGSSDLRMGTQHFRGLQLNKLTIKQYNVDQTYKS